MIVLVARELMITMRVQGLLRNVGADLLALEPDAVAIPARLAALQPRVVLLDLTVPEEVRVACLAAAQAAGAAVIAFGPHEDAAALVQARRLGASDVVARGALGHALVPLVAKHLARRPSPPDMPPGPGS